MEATLLVLVLHKTAALLSHITKDFTKHPLERIVTHRTCDGCVMVVGYVKSGAIEVATILCRIVIVAAERYDILLGTKET